jgi:Toprim domain-containing protein
MAIAQHPIWGRSTEPRPGAPANASDIAQALDKACREGRNWRCVCPLHGGHSLVLGDGNNTLLVKCFGGDCAPEDILAELRHRGLIEGRDRQRQPLRPPPSPPSDRDRDNDHERRQHEKAAWLWSQRQPIEGTISETYLRQARGITCPLPPTLAFLPPRTPKHHPAMIAAFSLPDEIEPGLLGTPRNVEAVHLTLLRSDGSGKADIEHPKLFVGSPKNLPIVLSPPSDLPGLAITEGIEDALTAHQATGLGAWAAGSAARMSVLAEALPRYIESVTVCAHTDQAGQDGALTLAAALGRLGVEVSIAEVTSRSSSAWSAVVDGSVVAGGASAWVPNLRAQSSPSAARICPRQKGGGKGAR